MRVFLVALVVGTIGLLVPLPKPAGATEVVVSEQSVEIDFPDRLTFNLEVDASEPIERLELRYQPVYSDVARAERPAFERGRTVSVNHELDTRIQYLPPGIEIEYRWLITFADGQVAETDTQSFLYIDNRYDWQQVSANGVTIYYYQGGSGFGEAALDVTQRTIDRFSEDFDVALEKPINVVLYGSVSEFQDALPYNSPEWIGGFADPGMNLIVAGIAPGDGAATEMGRMLTHEAIHLMVDQATSNPFNSAPRWLDEGLAIIYQEVQEQRFGRVLNLAVEEGRLIPVRALRSSFPSDPDLAIQSYAQSQSIVEYLVDEHGYESVSRLLQTYREGVSHEEAVQRSLGMSLDQLDADWKRWLGYEGDRADAPPSGPLAPSASERIEDALVTLGIMPFLVVGGAIVVVLGIIKMVRSVRSQELDMDVSPDVEYYGQDYAYEHEVEPDESDPWDRPQP
jgi:hypothetical protein